MNFDQLNYVKAILETGSITHAAEKIHISQSALSQSIVTLETELEHKLFERSKSGTFPTQNGRKLIPIILEILEAEEKLKNAATALSATLQGTLTIATPPSMFMTIVPVALTHFKENFPHIKVNIIEAENDEVSRLVKQQEVDIGMCSLHDENDIADEQFSIYSLFLSTGFKVIVPKESKFAFYETITLEDIQSSPFILFDRAFYNTHIKNFENQQGPLNILFNTKNPSVLLRSVSSGLGVSVVSDLMLYNDPYLKNESIAAIPIGHPFDDEIHFDALTSKKSEKRRLIDTFITYMRQAKDQLV